MLGGNERYHKEAISSDKKVLIDIEINFPINIHS
jgi:hypothetical protein